MLDRAPPDQSNANSAIELGPLLLARSSVLDVRALRKLLNVIRENPRVVLQAVRKARMRDLRGLATIEPRKSLARHRVTAIDRPRYGSGRRPAASRAAADRNQSPRRRPGPSP